MTNPSQPQIVKQNQMLQILKYLMDQYQALFLSFLLFFGSTEIYRLQWFKAR